MESIKLLFLNDVDEKGITFFKINIAKYALGAMFEIYKESYEIRLKATLRNFIEYCSKTQNML